MTYRELKTCFDLMEKFGMSFGDAVETVRLYKIEAAYWESVI